MLVILFIQSLMQILHLHSVNLHCVVVVVVCVCGGDNCNYKVVMVGWWQRGQCIESNKNYIYDISKKGLLVASQQTTKHIYFIDMSSSLLQLAPAVVVVLLIQCWKINSSKINHWILRQTYQLHQCWCLSW